MKPVFHHRLVNGYFEDPCLFVRLIREKRAILFDLGDIKALSASDITKISDVFVSHTHMDHFIGFDTLLRMNIRRDSPLNIYGYTDILKCIEGKLQGYSWNLISEYPCVINVFTYDGKSLTHSVFRAKKGFKKETISRSKSDGLLLKDPFFQVRGTVLDHGIPCLAYCLDEDIHINIDKDLLLKKGLSVGPWLSLFKKKIRENANSEDLIEADGKTYAILQLADIARITKGQKISYVTDIAMTKKNMDKVIRLVRDSDVLYCEAYFLEKDKERAIERFHLTAKACGSIARKAGVKKLSVIHFSPKYRDCPDAVIEEAMEAFQG